MKKPFFMLSMALYLTGMVVIHAQEPGIYEAVSNSNIRVAPSANAEIIGFLQQSNQIQVIAGARDNSWYQVQLDNGVTGYIHSSLLQPIVIGSDSSPSVDTAATTSVDAGGASNESAAAPPVASDSSDSPDAAADALSAAPEDAFLYIISPLDGDVHPDGKVWVRFGLRNMGVAPAGIEKQFTGHHHLLINTELPSLDQPIPNDDNYIHFGRGQTEYLLELPPGKHTIQLLLGDHDHVPHDPPVMSNKITIFVSE
jgi:hypothetical protein